MISNYILSVKFVILFVLCMSARAQPLTVSVVNAWGGIFAGEISPYEITLSGKQNSYTFLTWKLISKGRTLSNGQQTIRFINAPFVTTLLPLQTPPLKPGITLEAQLIIEVSDEDHSDQPVRYESKLDIYGLDLLFADQQFFKQLNIQLFDPIGKTSKIFEDLKIPYESHSKSQLINLSQKGLIIVAAGVEFNRHRGLINTLIDYAREGRKILLLQPSSGTFPILELSTNIRPSTMSFSDDSIVQVFAEDYNWISDVSVKTHGIALHTHHQAVLAQIVDYNQASWDWFQLDFDRSGGKFVICMLPFVKYIDHGPVPQIIFSRLLAYVNGQLTNLIKSVSRKAEK